MNDIAGIVGPPKGSAAPPAEERPKPSPRGARSETPPKAPRKKKALIQDTALGDCLAHGAPAGREAEWRYRGGRLKRIYQWLGGGHGGRAHPLATQLLIEVARGRDETPLEVLERHRADFDRKIEVLFGDLYANVLSDQEQHLIQALALYRSAIPHDHADALEGYLSIPGAWDGLDRRCLLSSNADHSLYYLHSLISGWLQARMGHTSHRGDETDPAEIKDPAARQQARNLHSTIARCWLDQLSGSRRLTNLNISRALEGFHHLVAGGEADRLQDIAVELLAGDLEWARLHIERLHTYLYRSRAPIVELRRALEYAAILDPDDHKVQRFLGESWAKEEGRGSPKALDCFEKACSLRPEFPPYWANLGRTLLAQGKEGAREFLRRLEFVEQDYPQAVDAHIRSIQSECLKLVAKADQAAALRLEKIRAGSPNATFYNDEAKARLEAGDPPGALEILDLAEKNGCADDFTAAIRVGVLQQSGQAPQAAALRLEKIRAGSSNAVFYNDEAKARLEAGDPWGALEILDLAEKNGCADDFTAAIRANVLQQSGQAPEAAALRMEKIRAGSRDAVFYNDEAKARLEAGDPWGALEILDLAEENRCADDYTAAIRADVLQQSGQAPEAAALRMEKIRAGSRDAAFYNDEAKARQEAGDPAGALEILDLAEENGCADDYTAAIRADVLQQSGQAPEAAALRMEKIRAGSRHAAFYADEAKARQEAGDTEGALEILDLAETEGCADDYTAAIRANVLRKHDTA